MHRTGRLVTLGLCAWFGVALIVGAFGVLDRARPPAPQILIGVLTLVTLGLIFTVRPLRHWCCAIPVRPLVALHLTRFIGFYFLYLASRGQLAPAFAVPAGRGDIAVAVGAVLLLLWVPPRAPAGRRFYLLWNVLGTLDILLVIVNAAFVGLADPDSMRALLHLPLSLLPTFLVPLIIVSHVLLFRRIPAHSFSSPEEIPRHV
jgi:hypothetical protein